MLHILAFRSGALTGARPAAYLVGWLIWTTYLIGLLQWAAARPRSLLIEIGTPAAATLLDGFRDPETAPEAIGGFPYQWSGPEARIALPASPNTAWFLAWRGWQAPETAVHLATPAASVAFPPRTGVRTYHLLLPALDALTLRTLSADAEIGLAMERVVAQRSAGPFLVDARLALASALLAVWAALLVGIAGLGMRDAALVLVALPLAAAWGVAGYAPYVARVLPRLAVLLAVATPGTLLVWRVLRRWHVPGYVVAAFALAVVAKTAGLIYPNYTGVDTSYHIQGVRASLAGDLFRVGGGQQQAFPYPPAVYMLIMPVVALFPGADWMYIEWLVLGASVVLDSTTIFLVYGMLAQTSVPSAVRRWAVWLYATIPAGFLLFWHATIAQNLAQWLGVCYLAAFVVSWKQGMTTKSWWLLVTLSFLANLGHFGVFLNFNLMWALVCLIWWRWAWQQRRLIASWVGGHSLSHRGLLQCVWDSGGRPDRQPNALYQQCHRRHP